MSRNVPSRIVGAMICLTVFCVVRAESQCVYPKITQFGAVDNFAAIPTDSIPYTPLGRRSSPT